MQAKVIAFPLAQQYHEVYHVRDAQSFIHDPGMIKMPDGRLLAFSPCWKKGPEPEYKVVVSESIDNGLCWKEICILPYSRNIASTKAYISPAVSMGAIHGRIRFKSATKVTGIARPAWYNGMENFIGVWMIRICAWLLRVVI